nr:alpha/beta fold hydrolase [uncultured Dongia sp.]
MRCLRLFTLVIAGLPALAAPPSALAIESTASVPIRTADASGAIVEAELPLTIFRPEGQEPFPAVVLSHGRPGATQRASMGRVKLSSIATTFLGEGFVVIVPTRIGYGIASGNDVEATISCEEPRYLSTFAAAADQIAAAVSFARTLPYVDPGRILLVGHSMGGAATVAAGVRNLPGVRAAISFNGGQGARPNSHPGEPCRPDILLKTFASLGAAKGSVPQLWIHTENDHQFSVVHARSWFSAFREAGGLGEFKVFPPYRDDGHWWFANEPGAWMSSVREFSVVNGLLR